MTDFEALRHERNRAARRGLDEMSRKMGWEADAVWTSFDSEACSCDCVHGGPCEHDFAGWRTFENGGETVCRRCGLGAMSHSVQVDV